MEFIDKQIAPPKSWEKFEELTRALFAKVWEDPLAQKNGRAGQKQHGVDVYGTPAKTAGTVHGVQCKGKDGNYGAKPTLAEFDAELAKADTFTPGLAHWTFATTASNDATLQRHAREVSERRVREGRFPVVTIGWETIQALLSSHSQVVEQFYPEHAGHFPAVLEALKALPSAAELEAIKRTLLAIASPSSPAATLSHWSEIRFEIARDLGPALMGRPLGPADVVACPVLPETAALLDDLERAGTVRLGGVAGAGKSICTLQAARKLYAEGWRVLRLDDPMAESVPTADPNRPTLLIIDDAHLARPGFLRGLEEQATATRRVLSAHTMADGKDAPPGIIQLDAQRAVHVIAEGLRAMPKVTLAAVRRADDRVGDRPGDERLDDRLDHAAQVATFPWQFCFILGGGWRRASALASSAKAAGADLVLAAAAIRQLATRDARCPREALSPLLDARKASPEADAAIDWLVGQRLLLAREDLRCPHQRLSGVLLGRILEGQDQDGRQAVARMLRAVLEDARMPLGGIALLLSQLSLTGGYGRWRQLVERQWLDPMLERCWAATTAVEIREACWALSEMHGYMADEMAVVAAHRTTLAGWIAATPEGAGYALGRIINHVHNEDGALGRAIVAEVDPVLLARAISTAGPLHACEIANLITMMRAGQDETWKAAYMAVVDRPALLRLVSAWPEDAWLSAVADLCEHFCYFEPEFGFDLIEALIPAISERMRADPQHAFHELNDIVRNALRLFDPLQVYVGKLAPTRRMKQVGRKLCACWSPGDLAAKLSRSTKRSFQSAAGVLSFMHRASPKQFEATVLAIDWDLVDATIGDDWASDIGDARMLLGVAYVLTAARPAIQALIARNEPRIVSLSTRLAAMAPNTASRLVAAGKRVAICHFGHVDWMLGMLVLADFAVREPALVTALLEPHYEGFAAALSQPSPSFYKEALLFLRLFAHVAPEGLTRVLDRIDVEKAARGWRNALAMRGNNRVRGGTQARQVAAFLVHHALGREDAVGDLARTLRREFPRHSVLRAETLEVIDLAELAASRRACAEADQ
ncbi:hypothetical protein ACETIH_23820 [Microvirga arabica]|uniref:Restriction endonuclease type IV Mrr domain-containing protein n=1 Tax=Microvirga arabica TaxID=1128671 RepID=A0ABV6YEF8_9HYPH